jgi:hypothetical protein
MNEKIHHLNPANRPRDSVAGAGNDGGSYMSDMSERLAKLEGAFDGVKMSCEGLRHGQNMTMGLLGVGFAVVIFFMGYLLTRIDNLPTEFERLNQTLSAAITASKQQMPQVILVPAPSVPAPQQPTTPQK